MQIPRIVGIYAPAPQSGKSTVAGFLVEEFGYQRIPFAKVLKLMCRPLLEALGYSIPQIAKMEGGDKSEFIVIEDNGIALPGGADLRRIYKTLGHDWGRVLIHDQIWITAWKRSVETALKEMNYPGVVADDMRYPNEFAAVRELGGQAWAVRRPGYAPPDDHPSEGQLQVENADFVIENTGTYDDLLTHLASSWSFR